MPPPPPHHHQTRPSLPLSHEIPTRVNAPGNKHMLTCVAGSLVPQSLPHESLDPSADTPEPPPTPTSKPTPPPHHLPSPSLTFPHPHPTLATPPDPYPPTHPPNAGSPTQPPSTHPPTRLALTPKCGRRKVVLPTADPPPLESKRHSPCRPRRPVCSHKGPLRQKRDKERDKERDNERERERGTEEDKGRGSEGESE